jgi:hypothetical protein
VFRRALACAVAAALVPAAAAGAATTFCVAKPSCTGTPEQDLPAALAAAAAASGRDRIELGAATIPYAGNATDAPGNAVDIVGASRHDTTLLATGLLLTMQEPTSTFSDARIAASGTPAALVDLTAGAVRRVDVDGSGTDAGATTTAFRLHGGGAVLDDAVVAMAGGQADTAVQSDATAAQTAPTVSGLVATAATGVVQSADGGLALANSDVRGRTAGVRASAGTITVDDTVVRATAALGLSADAGGGTATITARQTTVLLASAGTGMDAGAGGSVTADGVAIHGTGTPAAVRAGGAVTLDYSAYPFAGVTGVADGGTTHHDIDLTMTAPGFVDETAGDARLTAGSPLVDAGDPALTDGPATDLAGLPRLRDGNGDGTAVRDIGAYEYQRIAPTIAATATPTAAGTDQEIAFSATATDADPGEVPAIAWTFDDGATADGATASHAFATGGDHTATATATDPSGLTATSTVTVHIAADNAPPPATARGPSLFIRILRAKLDRRRTFLIGVFCPYNDRPRCTGSITVKRGTSTIARTVLRIQAAGTQIARLRVSNATANLVHRRRLLGVTATVVARNVEGSTTTRTFRVTLRPFR